MGIECGDGWKDMLNNLTDEIKQIQPDFKFSQVKEKFGTLRAYCMGAIDGVYDVIDKYEKISATTCEICGSKGKLCDDSWWMKVICNKCKED